MRYDDGRRNLHMPLKEQFRLTAAAYNDVVFDRGLKCRALCSDVFAIDPQGFDLAYLDPPYAPPRDDNDYIKRYHFLEGLSVYWRGQRIMEETATKKLAKRYTPFAYKRTIGKALADIFDLFRESIIVLSYNSQSIPDQVEITRLLRRVKKHVHCIAVPHRYHFGTHSRGSSAPGERVHLRRSVGRWQSSPSRSSSRDSLDSAAWQCWTMRPGPESSRPRMRFPTYPK